MKISILSMLALAVTLTSTTIVTAHGTEPHPKCKPGYVVADDHRCVKK